MRAPGILLEVEIIANGRFRYPSSEMSSEDPGRVTSLPEGGGDGGEVEKSFPAPSMGDGLSEKIPLWEWTGSHIQLLYVTILLLFFPCSIVYSLEEYEVMNGLIT